MNLASKLIAALEAAASPAPPASRALSFAVPENFHMKLKPIVTLFLATLALSLSAADSPNRLRFPVAGFSIAPLEAPPGALTCQALMMFLPAPGDLAASVNVQIQPYTGTIDEYITLTLKQFKDAGVKVIAQTKIGSSIALFEYFGELQGRSLHWYAKVQKAAGHVYLATATAPEHDWPTQRAQLKACVDSLRCETAEPAAAPSPASPHR